MMISNKPWRVPGLALLVLAVACIPVLQWIGGQIYYSGTVGMNSAYLLGFALVILMGARFEELRPNLLLDALFLSIGTAAVITVWLQIYQWLGMINPDDWWAAGRDAARPSGNFSQPNHAATFLGWGVCAAAWGCFRGRMGWACATLLAAYFLFGIALTGSRTAIAGGAVVIAAVFWWRKFWPTRHSILVVCGLAFYYLALLIVIGQPQEGNVLDNRLLGSSSISERKLIWQVATSALGEHPWMGYGWDQNFTAQLTVAYKNVALHNSLGSSHNLFLDILVWNGIPLGGLLCGFLLYWFFRLALNIKNSEQAILMVFLILVANHSLLEFPLHYAHFLLPTGWIIGALYSKVRSVVQPTIYVHTQVIAALYAVAMILLVIICVDYAKIEESSRKMRSEIAAGRNVETMVPEIWLLNQLSSQLELMRIPELTTGLTDTQLSLVENVARLPPISSLQLKAAKLLAINHRPEQASWILKRYCSVVPEGGCEYAQKSWHKLGINHPEIAAITWPVKFENVHGP
jgi:O-antigen ligase